MSWPTKKLGEVIDFLKGKKMPVTEEQRLGYEPYIGIDTLRTHEYKLFTPEKDGVRCSKDDVLVVWDGAYAGTVGIEVSGFAGSTVAKVVIKEPDLDSRFLRHFWEFNRNKIRNAAQGAAIPHLSKPFINNLKVLLPPLEIQKQIVELLDKIAEAQKLNDNLIQNTDELFQSLLHQELNPGRDWEIKKSGDVLDPQYGYTAAAQDSGKYRFIRITDINEDGELSDHDKKYVTVNSNEAKPYELNHGDLLLARTGATFGKILYFKGSEPSIFASFLIRLNPNTSITDPFYIWLFSRSRSYWQQAKSLMTGSGQPQFNANKLKQIRIPLPSLEAQKQIVAKLSAVQEYKTQLLAQKSKLKELFNSALAKSFSEKT